VKESIKKAARTVLGPALRRLSQRFEALQQSINQVGASQELLQARVDQLTTLNRTLLEQRDVETEVMGRALSTQRVRLEALTIRQQQLLEEIELLRESVSMTERNAADAERVIVDESTSLP
jgi:septal ring factor EnvC (AmiA/AmiB activator)